MYGYFKEKYPDIKLSERAYGERIPKKNISFCKLGEEECEVCDEYEVHEYAANLEDELAKGVKGRGNEIMEMILPEVCTDCDDWASHMRRVIITRKAY